VCNGKYEKETIAIGGKRRGKRREREEEEEEEDA
jgi:hypothetical protein